MFVFVFLAFYAKTWTRFRLKALTQEFIKAGYPKYTIHTHTHQHLPPGGKGRETRQGPKNKDWSPANVYIIWTAQLHSQTSRDSPDPRRKVWCLNCTRLGRLCFALRCVAFCCCIALLYFTILSLPFRSVPFLYLTPLRCALPFCFTATVFASVGSQATVYSATPHLHHHQSHPHLNPHLHPIFISIQSWALQFVGRVGGGVGVINISVDILWVAFGALSMAGYKRAYSWSGFHDIFWSKLLMIFCGKLHFTTTCLW